MASVVIGIGGPGHPLSQAMKPSSNEPMADQPGQDCPRWPKQPLQATSRGRPVPAIVLCQRTPTGPVKGVNVGTINWFAGLVRPIQ